MRFDLRRVRVEHQAEIFDEAAREGRPVDFRIGGHVRVVVADRTIDLAGQLDRGDLPALALEAGEHVRDLLAERRRRGSLAVRARQHRQRRVRVREVAQLRDHAVERRQQHAVARIAQHQRVGEIVDVLARAREMDEFPGRGEFGVAGDLLLDEVLDCLDVVVGGALDFLDALAVGFAEGVADRQ